MMAPPSFLVIIMSPENRCLLELLFLLGDITVSQLILKILLSGDECGLGQLLVVLRDLNLLAVLTDFLKSVIHSGKFLELFLQIRLHLGSNLVSSLTDDAHGLIDVARGLSHLDNVMHCSGKWRVSLLVIHIYIIFM